MARAGLQPEGPELRRGGWLLFTVLLVWAAVFAGWLDAPIHRPQDEGQLLVYPQLLLAGAVPQRDFFTSYPPGIFWLLAGVYQVFGASVTSERLVGLVLRLGVVAGVFQLARREGRAVALCSAFASACLLLPLRLEASAWLGGLALLLGSLAIADRLEAQLETRARSALLAGALAALALSFRLDLGLAVALSLVPLIAGAGSRVRRAWVAGFALGALPLAFHAARVGLGAFVEGLILEPVFSIGPQRRMPLGDVSLERARQLALLGGGVVAALAAAWRVRSARSVALAGLCVGLLPQALQRMDGDHLLGVGCVVAGLLPATLTSWLGARAAARARVGPDSRPPSRLPDPPAVRRGAQATSQVAARRRAQLGLVLVVLVFALPQWQLFAWLIDGQGPVRAAWVEHRGRSLPLASPADASHVEDVVRDLAGAAHAGQRLFIGPSDLSRTWYSDLHIHHLFPDLPPASYYLEMNPGSADRPGSRLAADLASADWLLLSRRWDLLDGVGASRWQGSAEPQRVVAELFALRSERGPYRLFERRREPARTP